MDDSDKNTQSESVSQNEDSRKDGRSRNLKEVVIEEIDKVIESPSSRALRIHNELRNSTNPDLIPLKDWDMICFSVEFLGLMTHTYPWLEDVAKQAARLVYTAHYNGYFSEDNETLKRDTESGRKVFV